MWHQILLDSGSAENVHKQVEPIPEFATAVAKTAEIIAQRMSGIGMMDGSTPPTQELAPFVDFLPIRTKWSACVWKQSGLISVLDRPYDQGGLYKIILAVSFIFSKSFHFFKHYTLLRKICSFIYHQYCDFKYFFTFTFNDYWGGFPAHNF